MMPMLIPQSIASKEIDLTALEMILITTEIINGSAPYAVKTFL